MCVLSTYRMLFTLNTGLLPSSHIHSRIQLVYCVTLNTILFTNWLMCWLPACLVGLLVARLVDFLSFLCITLHNNVIWYPVFLHFQSHRLRRERIKSEIESKQLQKGTKNESKPINLRYFVQRSICSTLHTHSDAMCIFFGIAYYICFKSNWTVSTTTTSIFFLKKKKNKVAKLNGIYKIVL